MFELLITVLSLVSIGLSAAFIMILLKFKRDMPDFIQIFDELGGNISKVFEEGFKTPAVSKAMGVLGKKSGEVRADKALVKKVAAQAMDQIPGIGLILKQFDLTPVEGLKLMNDPLIGPLIARGIAAAQGAIGKIGVGGGGGGGSGGSGPVSYGREE
ncbi:hypothetical protein ES705_27030 [subsurface metagenome]